MHFSEPAHAKTRGTPSAPDRRKESRQTVDTRAVLHLIPSGIDLPGRIADLSPCGCRLCTDAPFPLGVFRRVEVEFRLQGLPLRFAGVTQAIHDRRAIGIRFLDLSPRKRAQLDQLIAEILEARAAHETGCTAAPICQQEPEPPAR